MEITGNKDSVQKPPLDILFIFECARNLEIFAWGFFTVRKHTVEHFKKLMIFTLFGKNQKHAKNVDLSRWYRRIKEIA